MTPDTRTPIAPLIQQDAPDGPIDLGTLSLECQSAADKPRQPVTVQATQVFLPKPKLILRGKVPFAAGSPLDTALFEIGGKTPVDDYAINTSTHMGGADGAQTTITWAPSPFLRGNPSAGASALFVHLFSFHDFFSTTDLVVRVPHPEIDDTACSLWKCGYIEFAAGDWRITLSAHAQTADFIKLCNNGPDHALTHTLRITRVDERTFVMEDAEEVLRALHHFLSFSSGRWISMGYEMGVDASGTRVWERWGLRHGSRWRSSGSWGWWNANFGGADLVALWPGFWALWQNEIWKNHLREVLYWYLEANQQDRDTMSADGGLLLAQVALERIAWAYLVQQQHEVKPEEWGTMKGNQWPAKRQIYRTCLRLGIPVTGDPTRHEGFTDVPEMITRVRNDATHPDSQLETRKRLSFDAWNHANWVIELALLRLMNYSGGYANRLREGRWVGQTEPVPWMTSPSLPSEAQ